MDVPFLEGISETILKDVTLSCKKYSKGKIIYDQGEICSSMTIILKGSLVAYALAPNGSENVVFSFERGNIIGANLLFGASNSYPFTIYCIEDCELMHISKEDVAHLVKDYGFAMRMIKNISINSQGMKKKLTMYAQKSLKENLMDYFQALALEQKSMIVTLPMSKKQLADYMGVQRPSLFRELKKMKDEGLIVIENRKIELCDRD